MTGSAAPDQPAAAPAAAFAPTPLMEQYWTIKRAHPECLLFYRMGDFFELFFDDAAAAAGALDIALTRRGKHEGQDIPMCGVPVVSHEAYVARLIRRGFKVAICEQTEDPALAKKRGTKAVVRREVVRIVTAGTLVEETLLDARRCNYLAAMAESAGGLGVAWIDVSTAEFATQAVPWGEAGAVLARLEPGELLAPEPLAARETLARVFAPWRERTTVLPASRFDAAAGQRRLLTLFGVGALDAFGAFSPAETAAAGALVEYVELTQKGRLPKIAPPRRVATGTVLEIDVATRRNLELTETLKGERAGSLIGVLDRTLTGAGARLLRSRLAAPATGRGELDPRLDLIQAFFDDGDRLAAVRDVLSRCPDAERAIGRLSLGRGGPRDLACVRDALQAAALLQAVLAEAPPAAPPELRRIAAALGDHQALVAELRAALADSLPPSARDGGFIAAGYRAELDEQRRLRDDSRRLIAGLEARYARETGVASVKIRHNTFLGYYVEVPAKQADRLAADADKRFILRQSMVGAQRYTTIELGELESRIASAADEVLARELALFALLGDRVQASRDAIGDSLHALAELDVAAALADLARARNWVRPALSEDASLDIRGGRHPMVEAALAQQAAGPFVGNDLVLDAERRLWLLTGPNMAGKSTFLRQNALIVLLAQIGAFVPADAARIGLVDRLFSRVGAADDLAQGRSTFMVEMIETASILNQAGPRAFVILDEIGRGTATWDGLSIAWAVVEHLCQINRCRGLFATHYHELTALATKLPALSCHTMRVKEWRSDVVFLHEVAPGTADRSYGIHVARLAGLPAAAVARAEEVLHLLEQGEQSSASTRLADDLPLFAAAEQRQRRRRPPSVVEEELRALDPDSLAPREALDALYRLKRRLIEEG